MTTSPTDAHTLPKPPPWMFTNRIADMTHAVGERWCKTVGCMHLVDFEHSLCPGCADRAVRGR